MKFNTDRNQIQIVDDNTDVYRVMKSIADSGIQEDAFYVFDVNDLIQKFNNWKEMLPRVIPHYAVKCNDHSLALKILSSLGVGFDCASKEEIRKIVAMGVDPSRIIFANPTKIASHIRFAGEHGVESLTFDNETELCKIKTLHPNAKLLLRVRSDALKAQCPLGMKFGCNVSDARRLLQLARTLSLHVVGVSFHVGSGCGEPAAFGRSIATARDLFDMGDALGFHMRVLDIGGGFPGTRGSSLDAFAGVINAALDEYFPRCRGTTIIAEPGRYFVASAFTLATLVHSKREVRDGPDGRVASYMYYVNDGIYGSFSAMLFDHASFVPVPLSDMHSNEITSCSIWGPTCDGLDLIAENIMFPKMNIGEWICFENMGAYTFASATNFNGFSTPKIYSVFNQAAMMFLKDALRAIEDDYELEESLMNVKCCKSNGWNDADIVDPTPFSDIFDLNDKCFTT